MGYLLLRVLANALAIAIVTRVLPGIHVTQSSIEVYVLVGLVLGILNVLVKPILTLLTCSLVVLTLGLFIIVIDALMLMLTAALLPNLLVVDGFGWAFLGAIIIAVINMVLEAALGRDDNDRRGGIRVQVYPSDKR